MPPNSLRSGYINDPHSESGNACPKNFFGITDYAELHPKETALSLKRSRELMERPVTGSFNVTHLRAIHQYLFQDVFPWAGELRVVNISKGNSTFGPAIHIASALEETFTGLSREGFLTGLTPQTFAERAASFLGEINAIHPFREGNGRAQREFVRQLALHAGHPLSWAGFTQQQMTDASILSHQQADNSALSAMLLAALQSTRECL